MLFSLRHGLEASCLSCLCNELAGVFSELTATVRPRRWPGGLKWTTGVIEESHVAPIWMCRLRDSHRVVKRLDPESDMTLCHIETKLWELGPVSPNLLVRKLKLRVLRS